jgi:hypothetical protein
MKGKRTMDYTVHIDRSSDQVIPDLVNALQRRNLRVMITFDLQLARAHQVDCRCAYHDTEHCTCQYAVLMIYRLKQRTGPHRTITAHGRDGQVWVSLLKRPTLLTDMQPDHEALEKELLDLLLELAGLSHTEVVEAGEAVASET